MTEQLQGAIQARSDAIASRLDTIVSKIDALEEKFDAEMARIPVDIERRGEELSKMLVSRRDPVPPGRIGNRPARRSRRHLRRTRPRFPPAASRSGQSARVLREPRGRESVPALAAR